jgi:hypothetical protein
MKRTPLPPRTVPLRTLTRLARRPWRPKYTPDPVTAETTYLVWQRSGGRCEQGLVCGGALLDPARWDRMHRVRRESGLHEPSNLLAGCRADHAWQRKAGNRAEAERCGWVLPFATADPGWWPVLIGGRWWLLDDYGGRAEVEAE